MKPLCAVLFIALCGTAVAQPTFIRTYAAIPYAWGMATTSSGGLVIAGNFSDEEGYLLRLDRDGDVSWMKRYMGMGNPGGGSELNPCVLNRFYAVTVATDGKLVVVGSANGALSAQRSVSCYDSLGTWLWGQTSGVETHAETLDLAAAGNDNTVIVAGNSPDLLYQHATLFRYAVEDGTFLGGVRMLGGIDTRPTGIDFSADGNILMTTGQHGHQVMKLTPDLAPIWRLSWANFSPTLLCGEATGSTVAANDTVIAMIDPSGTLAWINELVVDGGVQDIAVRPNGRILALGQNGSAFSWLIELDSTGAVQWIRQYGNDGEDIALKDIELLPDGSAFLIGYDPVTDALCVVSVDQNGELGDCSFPTLSADVVPFASTLSDTLPTFPWSPGDPGELQEIDSTVLITVQVACGAVGYATPKGPTIPILEVIPNPMTDHAGLVVPEPLGTDARIVLLDVNGRMLRTMNGNGSREMLIERGHLESGMYVLRVTSAGVQLGATRIVVY
jgi:hypothetical protein